MTRSSWKAQCASLLQIKTSMSMRTAQFVADEIGKVETLIRGNKNSHYWEDPEEAADFDMIQQVYDEQEVVRAYL